MKNQKYTGKNNPMLEKMDVLKPKILVVEDDKNQREAIVKLLRKLKAEVFEAPSGQKALSMLIRDDFMLVLLDINMPYMNGIETAQLMRSNKRSEHIPIIYMTAYNRDEKSISEGYKLGAVDYMIKPLREEILLSKVDIFLRFYKMEQERIYIRNIKDKEERERELNKKFIEELKDKNIELKKSQLAALNLAEDAQEIKENFLIKSDELKIANKEITNFTQSTSELLSGLTKVFSKLNELGENENLPIKERNLLKKISNSAYDICEKFNLQIEKVKIKRTLEVD